MKTIKDSEADKKGIVYSPNIPILLLDYNQKWSVVVTDPKLVMKTDQSFEPLKEK